MTNKVYPYRQPNGYCSVFQAVDFDDAHNSLGAYKGIIFCEMPKPPDLEQIYLAGDLCEYVDDMLAGRAVYCTHKTL